MAYLGYFVNREIRYLSCPGPMLVAVSIRALGPMSGHRAQCTYAAPRTHIGASVGTLAVAAYPHRARSRQGSPVDDW
jgi:hypothetical protein